MPELRPPDRLKVFAPGDGLLHPLVLMAIAALIVNDHVLKAASPGFVTGKLSDVAGLLFFPLLLQAVVELLSAAVGLKGRLLANRIVLLLAVVLTGLVFSAVKLFPGAEAAYSTIIGTGQWAVAAMLTPSPGDPWKVQLLRDPTDLIALPVLLLSLGIGLSRANRGNRAVNNRTAALPRAGCALRD